MGLTRLIFKLILEIFCQFSSTRLKDGLVFVPIFSKSASDEVGSLPVLW